MLIEDFGATPVWWCVGQRARACVERGTNERRARVGGVNNLYVRMRVWGEGKGMGGCW